MLTHECARRTTVVRRLVPAAFVAVSTGAVVVGSALPAAATPAAWGEVPEVSVLGFLLVLVILPVGLAVVVTLLTLLPSLARDKGYEKGAGWRAEPQWFGSPTKGVEAADDATPEQVEAGRTGSGGASVSW